MTKHSASSRSGTRTLLLTAAAALAFTSTLSAGDWRESKARFLQSDFPYTKAAIKAPFPEGNLANKGISIVLPGDAFVCFDTDLLRVSAGWTGNYITTRGVSFDGAHGAHPGIDGDQKFGTANVPGWAKLDGKFTDPREEPFGPVPADLAKWQGLYLVGDKVVLTYSALGTDVLEFPWAVNKDGQTGFVRNFRTSQVRQGMKLLVCSAPGDVAETSADAVTVKANGKVTKVAAVHAPEGASLVVEDGNIVLKLPKGTRAATFKLIVWNGAEGDVGKFAALTAGDPMIPDYKEGGPTRWPETAVTEGQLATSATEDGAYVVDRITPPMKNPWNRQIRFGGMDFFSDGTRAALSTWEGDVWIVEGIDQDLDKLVWKRFASGGFELLGLKIVDDVIYTTGRDEITRYHDLNGDGEADYYESFNNEITSSQGFHEFAFDLHTDAEGNFYLAKAGPVRGGGRGFGGGGGNGEVSAHAGTVLKVSKDGSKLEVYATGFRAPNGIGVSPTGQVTTGDNEGTWMPACPINWVKPGGFAGVEDLAHKSPLPEFDKPLCWLTKSWDNSGGGQAWVTSDKWGPFGGRLLHMSYGQSSLYLVLPQEVDGQMQGGVVKFPIRFTSSAMRARFNPKDGQLYVAGLRGWQSNAATPAGFDRVRYTGKKVYTVTALKVTKAGIQLTFTQPLNQDEATDPGSYAIEAWNYRRSEQYGSPELSVKTGKNGHDKWAVESATLSKDGKTVTLKVPDLQPANQVLVRYNIESADGEQIFDKDVLHTIHLIP